MEPRRPPESKRPPRLVGFAWAVLALALVLLVVRGVLPGLSFSGDFTMIHAGATAWIQGEDLYDFKTLYDTWQANGGGNERPREEAWFVALYPPTTYAVLAPLGALNWHVGRAVWVFLSLLSLAAVAAWGAAWLPAPGCHARSGVASPPAPIGSREPHPLEGVAPGLARLWLVLLLATWLSAGPVATTLEFGQLGLVVLGLVVFAGGTPRWRPPAWTAGLALALAGCLKPQLAGVFALGFVAVERWRELGWTIGIGSAIATAAVLRLEAAGVAWISGLLDNLHRFAGTGFADPSPANRVAWQMVNLEPLWLRFFPGGAAMGVAGALLVSVVGVLRRVRAARHAADLDRPDETADDLALWVMSVAAVVTLLIAYHRAYDAVLLAVPAVWAVRSWLQGDRPAPLLVLVGVAVFWPPLPELLNHLAHHTRLPASEAWPFALETVMMFHRNAVLLGVLVVLLLARTGGSSTEAGLRPPEASGVADGGTGQPGR